MTPGEAPEEEPRAGAPDASAPEGPPAAAPPPAEGAQAAAPGPGAGEPQAASAPEPAAAGAEDAEKPQAPAPDEAAETPGAAARAAVRTAAEVTRERAREEALERRSVVPEPTFQPVSGPPLHAGALSGVKVGVHVEIGRVRMPLDAIAALDGGDLVELDCYSDDPAYLYVNGRRHAAGQLQRIGGEWSFKLIRLLHDGAA